MRTVIRLNYSDVSYQYHTFKVRRRVKKHFKWKYSSFVFNNLVRSYSNFVEKRKAFTWEKSSRRLIHCFGPPTWPTLAKNNLWNNLPKIVSIYNSNYDSLNFHVIQRNIIIFVRVHLTLPRIPVDKMHQLQALGGKIQCFVCNCPPKPRFRLIVRAHSSGMLGRFFDGIFFFRSLRDHESKDDRTSSSCELHHKNWFWFLILDCLGKLQKIETQIASYVRHSSWTHEERSSGRGRCRWIRARHQCSCSKMGVDWQPVECKSGSVRP